MNSRNHGSYSNHRLSPPRAYRNDSRFYDQSKQSFGGHVSQPYYREDNPQNSRNYNNNDQNNKRNTRFDDSPPRDLSQSYQKSTYTHFSDHQIKNFNDRPNRIERKSQEFERKTQELERKTQEFEKNLQQQQNYFRNPQQSNQSQYDQSRPNFDPSRDPQNRPRPSETATSSSQLQMKLKFSEIFTVARKNENGVNTYNCRLCKLTNLAENNLGTHATGKRHKHHLKMRENIAARKYSDKMGQHKSISNKHFCHRPMFDSIIRDVKQPLVALTYTVEILDQMLKEPSYVCVLCKKRCDPRTIVNHLMSQTHRMNYLERHFPRLITILHNNRRFNEDMPFRQLVLINIAKVLEETFGRSTAFVYDGSDYESTKEIIFENINKKKHISQDDIPDVEGVLLEGINFDGASWETNNAPNAPTITEQHPQKRHLRNKVVEDYRNEVRYATEELRKKFEDYRHDPESHPFYKKEWELFWNRKVDEMTVRGLDPKNCNFHSEWCEFFLDRMKELHCEEVKWKMEQLRRKFGLTSIEIEEMNAKRQRMSDDVRSNSFSEQNKRFDSNFDDDSDEDYTIDAPRIPKDELYVKEKKIFDDFVENLKPDRATRGSPSTLIATLRLLSSLEAELGLLAPKVLDLLSKSLAFERENPKLSDELLFDSENLNLIETVKEKILGMEAANLISPNKQNAAQKAIVEIENLIEKHEMMVKVRASLREMGKMNPTVDEVEMLMGMMKRKNENNRAAGSGERSYLRGREMIEKSKMQQIRHSKF